VRYSWRTVIVVNHRQLPHFVLLFTRVLFLIVVRLLAYFFSHVLLPHFVVLKPGFGGLSKRFEFVDFCAYLYAESCVVRSQINAIFGQHQRTKFALVIL
jgi:hypothetical protein